MDTWKASCLPFTVLHFIAPDKNPACTRCKQCVCLALQAALNLDVMNFGNLDAFNVIFSEQDPLIRCPKCKYLFLYVSDLQLVHNTLLLLPSLLASCFPTLSLLCNLTPTVPCSENRAVSTHTFTQLFTHYTITHTDSL